MHLIERERVGVGVHRSGWPWVVEALGRSSGGLLLDDCVEQSFLFGRRVPHDEPWVGVFHFPHRMLSPLACDVARNSAYALLRSLDARNLARGVALTEGLAAWLEEVLRVPFLAIKHPTPARVPQWVDFDGTALQAGWHLRDTRFIYRMPEREGWRYLRVAPYQEYQENRDAVLRTRAEINRRVETIPRLTDAEYDNVMTRCLCVSYAFGAAACNVVVECIARGTPLLTSRCDGNVEYLGEDYCLYADDHPTITPELMRRASEQLAARRGDWMSAERFAEQVGRWTDEGAC